MMIDETSRYEAEAAQTRERIAATIDDLQARLSPKALVESAIDSISSAGSRVVTSARDAAAGHPMTLAAAGLAVGIGVLASSRVARAKVEYGDSYAAYADYDDGYAADLAASDPPESGAMARIGALQHQAHVTVDDNPLAVLAVGLATGALLGAVIRVSELEATTFGSVHARLLAAGDAAVATAREQFDTRHLSIAGGTEGITARLTASLVAVITAAGAALARPVTPGSPLQP